jgi:GxxExxY protein
MTQIGQIETDKLLHRELTELVLKVYYTVYNELGFGFLEKVYQNSMLLALSDAGFKVEGQKKIDVYFQQKLVGEYYADIVVNDLVILELKAVETLVEEHEYQLINYLKATKMEVGLLLNFGKKPQFKRKIYTNDKKKIAL